MPKVFALAKLKLVHKKRPPGKSRTAVYSSIVCHEYSCTRSSGPLPAAVKEVKTERIKSCAHHNGDKDSEIRLKTNTPAGFFPAGVN